MTAGARSQAGAFHAGRFFVRVTVVALIGLCFERLRPDAPHLALERWLGARILTSGIPRALGPEHYGTGAAWAVPGWLGATLAGFLQREGGTALAALAGFAIVVCGLAAVERLALARGADHASAIGALVLAFAASAGQARAGSPLVAIACAPCLQYVATIMPSKLSRYVAVAAVTILWNNFSPFGMFAPLLVGIAQVDRTRRDAVTAVAVSAVALLINPFGWSELAVAGWTLRLDPSLAFAAPLTVNEGIYGVHVILPLLITALAVTGSERRLRGSVVAVAASLTLVFFRGDLLPLATMVCAPILAGEFSQMRPSLWPRASGAAVIACTVFIAVAGAKFALDDDPADASALRNADVRPLIASAVADGSHHLLCSQPEWCDEALGNGLATYADDRYEAYDFLTIEDTARIEYMVRGWHESLRRVAPDVIITTTKAPSLTILPLTHQWRRGPCTDDACLLVRTRPT